MPPSSEIDDEIARLMRDPNALRSDPSLTPPSDAYDNGRTPLDAVQLAQLGPGNPAGPAQPAPFNELFGDINAAQHLTSQNGFIQTDRDPRRNRRMQDFQVGIGRQYPRGRFQFLSTGPFAQDNIPGGIQRVLSSTTYAYDDATGAYATISATPARPMVVIESNGRLFVRPFHR